MEDRIEIIQLSFDIWNKVMFSFRSQCEWDVLCYIYFYSAECVYVLHKIPIFGAFTSKDAGKLCEDYQGE